MFKPVSGADWMSLEEVTKMKKLLELQGLRFIDTFTSLNGLKRLHRRTLKFMKIVLARAVASTVANPNLSVQ